jgi:hypothetical protein
VITAAHTDERVDESELLCRAILRLLQGHTNEAILAALGSTIQCLLDTVAPDRRMEAAQEWCRLLLDNARDSLDRGRA